MCTSRIISNGTLKSVGSPSAPVAAAPVQKCMPVLVATKKPAVVAMCLLDFGGEDVSNVSQVSNEQATLLSNVLHQLGLACKRVAWEAFRDVGCVVFDGVHPVFGARPSCVYCRSQLLCPSVCWLRTVCRECYRDRNIRVVSSKGCFRVAAEIWVWLELRPFSPKIFGRINFPLAICEILWTISALKNKDFVLRHWLAAM